jgi:hypothetical protein
MALICLIYPHWFPRAKKKNLNFPISKNRILKKGIFSQIGIDTTTTKLMLGTHAINLHL